jgi:PKD domain
VASAQRARRADADAPTPTPPPAPDVLADAVWTAPSGVRTGQTVTLDGSRSKGNPVIGCTWSFEDQSGGTIWGTKSGCKISMKFQNADRKYVKLIVRDQDGDTDSQRRSFMVSAS